MDISVAQNNVTIAGNIKSVADYQAIKSSMDSLISSYDNIVVNIPDSISVTSSVIGYFTKLVQKEGITLTVKVGDATLYELFDELNLVKLFNVRKV
jgi:hypothetical protein